MEITNIISDHIKSKTPISFSKYGDGEYLCAISKDNNNGQNCDNDTYTQKLGNAVLESFKYMVEIADNSYLGIWHNEPIPQYWESQVSKTVKWAKYHTIIDFFEEGEEDTKNKVELFKTIKESNLEKIIICNNLLIKSKILLNIDHMINIPFNNWFDSYYDNVIEEFKNIINPNKQYIIITCCGMSAKVVIADLHKLFPNNIYLDFGSALDEICTKRNTRHHENHYHLYMKYYKEILPPNWDN